LFIGGQKTPFFVFHPGSIRKVVQERSLVMFSQSQCCHQPEMFRDVGPETYKIMPLADLNHAYADAHIA